MMHTASRRFIRKHGSAWLYLLPILGLHLLVVGYPSIASVYYSLTEWSGLDRPRYVGFDNYLRILFRDSEFRAAFVHNLIWLVMYLVVPFLLALIASAVIARLHRGGLIYRTVLFIPNLLPSVVVAFLWRALLDPTIGVPDLLLRLGILHQPIAVLGRPATALVSIAFIDTWRFWPFLLVLFLTAIQSIDPQLYDAAKIDGASAHQEFWHVTLPGIRPVLLFMYMMVAIWSFLVFDYVWILTQGGPAGASDVMATVIYRDAFINFDAGYASAEGLSLSVIAGLVVVGFIIARRRREEA